MLEAAAHEGKLGMKANLKQIPAVCHILNQESASLTSMDSMIKQTK